MWTQQHAKCNAMSLTISIGTGAPQGLADLGVLGAILQISNQGQDSLRLTLGCSAAEVNITNFPPFAKVVLSDGEGTVFTGWLDNPAIDVEGTSQRCELKVNGPWRWLDRANFSQYFVDRWTDPAAPILTEILHQIPFLNQGNEDPTFPARLPIGAVILDAVDQCPDVAYNSGDLEALTLQLPWSEKQNVSCGSVVRNQLSWIPSHTLWWDYSQSPPKMRITPPPTGTVENPSGVSFNVTQMGVDAGKIKLMPRFDLLVKRVVISYQSQTSYGERSIYQDDSGTPDSDASRLGTDAVMRLTFPLQPDEPYPPNGVAAAYLRATCRLYVDTEFTIYDESLRWDILPGQLWGFAGVASQWSSYTSAAQVITRDLFKRSVTIKLGAPGHLGLQNMIDLAKSNLPRAGGMGGSPAPAPTGNLTIGVYVSTGDPDDLAELKANTTIVISGPSGTQTLPCTSGSAAFTGLKAGYYTVSANPTLGWGIDTAIPQTLNFLVVGGSAETHGLVFSRESYMKLGKESDVEQFISFDADAGDGGGAIVEINGQAGDPGTTPNFSLKASVPDNDATLILNDAGDSSSTLNSFSLVITDPDNAEELNLDIEPRTGIASVAGKAGTGAQNFELSADDDTGTTSLGLYDAGDAETILVEIDDSGMAKVIGGAGTGAQNFELSADDDAGITSLGLYDAGDAETILVEIDDSGTAKVTGGAGTGAQNFLILADDLAGTTTLDLFDATNGEELYLKIDDTGTAQITGSAGSSAQNFEVTADDTAGTTSLYFYNADTAEELLLEIDDSGVASIHGQSGGSSGCTFDLTADDSASSSRLALGDNDGSNCTLETGTLTLDGGSESGLIRIDTDDGLYIHFHSDNTIEAPDPGDDVTWQTLNVANAGNPATMKVLGTEPVDD